MTEHERQPESNDFRKRSYRPLYVETFTSYDNPGKSDSAACVFAEKVSDLGGEVIDIRPYATRYTADEGCDVYHHRAVTYRAMLRIYP